MMCVQNRTSMGLNPQEHKIKNDISVEVLQSQFGPFHTSNPTLLRTILVSKQEPYRNTQANDSLDNATPALLL